jgi:hypothetical protein
LRNASSIELLTFSIYINPPTMDFYDGNLDRSTFRLLGFV